MLSLYVTLLLLHVGLGLQPEEQAPIVTTSLGRIEGSIMKNFADEPFFAYRGIPYAKPPVGELRFAKPEPVEAWGTDIQLDGTKDSLMCPQALPEELMTEDCLKINVYVKKFGSQLPVLVFIHGGGNIQGSAHSSYDAGPEYIMNNDMIFVSFNYRLGALGFLSTGTKTNYTGNYGYYDQLLALQWVQSHIGDFGGDAKRVTIMGMSAGSMAVSLHLASPLSKDLFHAAILMSGAATSHYDINNLYWTQKLALEVGCPIYEPNDVIGCLRNVPWQRIASVCANFEPYRFVNLKWNYEIDGDFLPKHPSQLIASGNFNRVPLLVSYTANELDYSACQHVNNVYLLDDFNKDFNYYAPGLFQYKPDDRKSMRLKTFYLGQNVQQINQHNIEAFGRIFSDSIIGHGVYRLVDLARAHTKVYYSRFDYISERSASPMTQDNKHKGVAHADDLQYVVTGQRHGTLLPKNHTDIFMMQRLTQWFAHFVETGLPLDDSQQWPSSNATHVHLLYNNKTTTIGKLAYAERYALWDQLFPRNSSSILYARIQLCFLGVLLCFLIQKFC